MGSGTFRQVGRMSRGHKPFANEGREHRQTATRHERADSHRSLRLINCVHEAKRAAQRLGWVWC